ncbi:Sodium/sulfate symporter [Cokeromyces recurvatus]|uniref:Sodium/sulfate symporter n=1 Tax=Cokeromyces recurvatus TaxID=90255 RepID=UPI00221FECB3|nr:Sodium/sulfate symporter [Cokeromyces recurvatus]KAI7907695.1 Sodium/sulfate symporter [Cokeromyces recurvatus]
MVVNYQAIDVDVVSQNTLVSSETASLLSTTDSLKKETKFKNLISLLPSIILGTIIWFGVTPDEELTVTAIHLLAVFISCICALITTNVEISMLVLTGLTLLAVTQSFECVDHLTGTLTECRLCGEINPLTGEVFQCEAGRDSFELSLEGFSSPIVWLIFTAFHLGKAIEVTKLGQRLSLIMIKSFGKHDLGLAYAIVFSELILAPFVPSNTARGGGIVLPVVQSIATTLESTPDHNPEVGSFLILVGNHANLLSASMYLTGMASNPIVIAKANQLFPNIHFGFMVWLQGSIIPGLICAAFVPILIRWSLGFNKGTPNVGKDASRRKRRDNNVVLHAKMELNKMGPMSVKEWQLCFTLLGCLCCWITSNITHLEPTLVALIGIVALLYMGTISWDDVSSNIKAWDTLFWLGGFVTIAQHLSEAGASSFLGHKISYVIQQFNLPSLPILTIAYFLTTFLFSSLSAHTVAFVSTFFDAGYTLGANPVLLTAFIAYFSSLGGCMTNYSTGMSAMYYALGYVSRGRWFMVGFQMAIFYLFIYFTIGYSWWTFLGWK